MRRLKIAYVHNVENTFIDIDRRALSTAYDVIDVYWRKKGISIAALSRALVQAVVGFGWFASWHTFVFVVVFWLLRREFILVIGGYDLANLPEIGYGHQRGGPRKWISRATMHLATRLMTNSKFSQGEAETNAGLDPAKVEVIYHGVPDVFDGVGVDESKPVILTVGNVDKINLTRKGHEAFVRAAALLPDLEFRLIGAWRDDAIDHLRAIASPNVVFGGRVDDGELRQTFRDAAVYVQVSSHEGFGVSLAEGMLACCVPVVTRVGALPEVVGNCGIYVDFPVLAEGLAKAIREAFENRQCALAGRKGVLDEFDEDKSADPVTRVPDGIFIVGMHGFKILQPPGPVRLV